VSNCGRGTTVKEAAVSNLIFCILSHLLYCLVVNNYTI
jgi:hypothetical protein